MQKISFIILILVIILVGCDPSESLDAIIINNTATDLKINFVSASLLSQLQDNAESLNIKPFTSESYQRVGSDSGIGQVGLSLIEFDSIYITNLENTVLKVYKENTTGKNIYNIDEYWTITKPSKNHFEYTYEITNEDIQ